jgi:peptidylprolyl isomerase
MKQARNGNTVKVHYRGTLKDGTEFDSSHGKDPLTFTLGSGSLIPGFEKAVDGMEVGQEKTVEIPAAEAYGQPDEDLFLEFDRDQFPPEINLEVGQHFRFETDQGTAQILRVIQIIGDRVLVDGNHPLAGEDLTFSIRLEEIIS